MKRKNTVLIVVLVIIFAIIAVPYVLYMSLEPYEWNGTYLLNTKTGIKYQSNPELNRTEALDTIKPDNIIGRIKGDSLFFKTWVKRIEGMDQNKYIYLQGLMYFEVLETTGNDSVPKDFNFTLKYGIRAKNVIDTFEGTYEKDLVSAGTAKTKLNFTAEEMKQIYDKLQAIDILNYPTSYTPLYADNPEPGTIRMVEPYSTYHLYLTFNGNKKEINWIDSNASEIAKAKDLRELFNYIDELIRSKEEYKKLPEAVGGYD